MTARRPDSAPDAARADAPGRRRTPDRRARRTPWISRHWLTGRRRGGRRDGERRDIFTDRFRAADCAIALAVLIFCVADAWLTLDLLDRGGAEWNPLMNALIECGPWAFITVKVGITLMGLAFLLIFGHFGRVRRAAGLLLVLYTLLMGWHAWVRLEAPDPPRVSARTTPVLREVWR